MTESAHSAGAPIVLGGRAFRIIAAGNARRERWLAGQIHAAGIDGAVESNLAGRS